MDTAEAVGNETEVASSKWGGGRCLHCTVGQQRGFCELP